MKQPQPRPQCTTHFRGRVWSLILVRQDIASGSHTKAQSHSMGLLARIHKVSGDTILETVTKRHTVVLLHAWGWQRSQLQ